MRTGGWKLPSAAARAALALAAMLAAGGCGGAPGGYFANVATPEAFGVYLARPDKPVFTVFHRHNCLSCIFLAPMFTALSNEYAGRVEFVDVDGKEGAVVRSTYTVRRYPTAILFVRGKERFRWVEVSSKSSYVTILESALTELGQTAPTTAPTSAPATAPSGPTPARL